MYMTHGTYPWKDWDGIWTYHTKFIPAGAAKLLIEQAIRCSGKADEHDQLADEYLIAKDGRAIGYISSVENFVTSGFLNKAFRVVRVTLDDNANDDKAMVVAVYNHDGAYHLITALEHRFFEVWDQKNPPAQKGKDGPLVTPRYPDQYTIESVMRGG